VPYILKQKYPWVVVLETISKIWSNNSKSGQIIFLIPFYIFFTIINVFFQVYPLHAKVHDPKCLLELKKVGITTKKISHYNGPFQDYILNFENP
jgi:hypothetical protein